MRPINKYIKDLKVDGLSSKLLSYSAMAAAFVATGPDANAQCVGETATPGAPIGVDIDGDGTDDVLLFAGATSYLANYGTATVPVGSIAGGTVAFPSLASTAQAIIPATNVAGYPYFGCYLFSAGAGVVAGPATLAIPSVIATATATPSAVINYTNAFYLTYYATYVNINYGFVTAAGANQIVGLSATGSGVCGLIDSAPGVSGVGTSAFVGYNASIFYSATSLLAGGVMYDFPSASVTAMTNAVFAYGPAASCATDTASIFGGYYAGLQFTISTPATAVTPPIADVTFSGPYLLAGPYYGNSTVPVSANPVTHVAVQFESGGETYNGWVALTFNADGSLTCAGSGYQQCSLETATDVGAVPGGCITVGTATNQSALCAADIPTVGEWGLILLGLMMSITAVVGIRQRRKETENVFS